MKFSVHFLFLFSLFLISFGGEVIAEDNVDQNAEAVVSEPSEKMCGVLEDVTVPLSKDVYCDIYQRQLGYKGKADNLKSSLEERRISYEKDHFAALENYRVQLEALYAEQSKEFQKNLDESDGKDKKKVVTDKKKGNMSEVDEVDEANEAGEEQVSAKNDVVGEAENPDVKEKVYPPEEKADGEVVKKKVVVPVDAPDFDTEPDSE